MPKGRLFQEGNGKRWRRLPGELKEKGSLPKKPIMGTVKSVLKRRGGVPALSTRRETSGGRLKGASQQSFPER